MVSTNSTIVARPRLIHRLHEAAKYPVVLIIAPAGFGKTTAVRQLLAFCTDPILISVPPGITSLYQFIRAFAQGCSVRFPAMAEPPVEFAANVPLSKYIDLYASWAVAHLKDVESVIAIDDLQNVPAELGIAEFFGRLSDNCKSHLQLILASRTPDNLPLVHWQAYGEATSAISADDLRITVDEATELARAVGSLATEEQLATWVSQTKGFPIPLAFAIRASTTRDRVRDIMDDARSLTFSFLV
jgi:LuxR family maltose regulon positive regulatory protein